MSDASQFDPYAMPPDGIMEPPQSLWAALRKIGPGIILAGSIIGSGELLLTTALGAEYGFAFLWLIIFSCIVKVFVQIELGRYAISSGKPTLGALNEFPGPKWRVHWLVWWWLIMLLATVSQLGAMIGGVAQALYLAFPGGTDWLAGVIEPISASAAESLRSHREYPWAVVTAFSAVGLLLIGGYKSIERITTVMEAGVTGITVLCVMILPASGYPFRGEDIVQGLHTVHADGSRVDVRDSRSRHCGGVRGIRDHRRRRQRTVRVSLLVSGERVRAFRRAAERGRGLGAAGPRGGCG